MNEDEGSKDMKRFTVPLVVHVDVVVDAPDRDVAISEAVRLMEAGSPPEGFVEGWNDVQRRNGASLIESVSDGMVQPVDPGAVSVADVPDEE